jgi:hypothetical protein
MSACATIAEFHLVAEGLQRSPDRPEVRENSVCSQVSIPMCPKCSSLLDSYDATVRDFSEITRKLSGALGDDLKTMYDKAEKLRQACIDAHREIMDHWEKEHHNLAT